MLLLQLSSKWIYDFHFPIVYFLYEKSIIPANSCTILDPVLIGKFITETILVQQITQSILWRKKKSYPDKEFY